MTSVTVGKIHDEAMKLTEPKYSSLAEFERGAEAVPGAAGSI